jgi:hypothetical protein
MLQGCTNSINENAAAQLKKSLVFPNPSLGQHQLKFNSINEFVEIYLIDQSGKILQKSFEGQLNAGQQLLTFEIHFLQTGLYRYLLKSASRQELVSFQKL